jgi:hypothetical protein
MIPIRRAPILRRDHSASERSGRRHTCAAWPRRRATPRPTRDYQVSDPWQVLEHCRVDGFQLVISFLTCFVPLTYAAQSALAECGAPWQLEQPSVGLGSHAGLAAGPPPSMGPWQWTAHVPDALLHDGVASSLAPRTPKSTSAAPSEWAGLYGTT